MGSQNRLLLGVSGIVSAMIVAALALFANLIPSDRMPWFIAAVAIFAIASGLVGLFLNFVSEKRAENVLGQLYDDCKETLDHVQREHVSAITRQSIIHDIELEALEKSAKTSEIWVVAPLDLRYEVPGKPFFDTLQENVDQKDKKYTYIVKESEFLTANAREIHHALAKPENITLVILSAEEWNNLPISGIPVTIHNPGIPNSQKIYIATQEDDKRGRFWSVFTGWAVGSIGIKIENVVKSASNQKSLTEF